MRRGAVPGLAGAVLLALALLSRGTHGAADDGRLRVVATTTQVADFVRNIGGDRINLTQLLGPNVDPHDFEPAPADLKAVNEAKVLVRNGLGLESWMGDIIEDSGFAGRLVVASDGVRPRTGDAGHQTHGAHEGLRKHDDDVGNREHGAGEPSAGEHGVGEHGASDPHVWHDPRNAKVMVRNIAAALIAADPAGRPVYATNLAAYEMRLTLLDTQVAAAISRIPVEHRELVTNHDSFGYYADRYGLHVVGAVLPSFETSAELSGQDIESLAARIRQTGVRAVFAESSLHPDAAMTLAREAGVRVVTGADALYTDTLGPKGSPAATYLDMVRHNTAVIVDGLS